MEKTENTDVDQSTILLIRRAPDRFDRFIIPYQHGISLLWAIRYVYEQLDPSLAFPHCLCRMGKCGACTVLLDGKPKQACALMLEPGKTYRVEPLPGKKIVRDLVTE